jgi:nicotinate dehydrogenase subunit A
MLKIETMFHVNQKPVHFAGSASTPLLSVLRDELALSGPKFGCGQGECGACMVLVNGQPQTACNLPVDAVQGQQVVTLEGLGTAAEPHPVQTAFIEHRAAQCGYCVAGIITSAAALLARNPVPSRAEIVQALDKHLCRCGAQQRMIAAVQSAAAATRSAVPNEPSGEPFAARAAVAAADPFTPSTPPKFTP